MNAGRASADRPRHARTASVRLASTVEMFALDKGAGKATSEELSDMETNVLGRLYFWPKL